MRPKPWHFTILLLFLPLLATAQSYNSFTINYHRYNYDYEGWGLHVWDSNLALTRNVSWGSPLLPTGRNDFGVYFKVPLQASASTLSFILHFGEIKNTEEDVNINFGIHGYEVWILEGDPKIYSERPRLPSDPPEDPDATDPYTTPATTERIIQTQIISDPSTQGKIIELEVQLASTRERLAEARANEDLQREKVATLAATITQQEAELETLRESSVNPLAWIGSISLGGLFMVFGLMELFIILNLRKRLKVEKAALEVMSQQKIQETEDRLMLKSVIDELTGLPNRAGLNQALPRALNTAQRYSRKLALLFIDLDGFKPVNDSLGHDAGDYVLKTIGERFKVGLRSSDLVCRLGGDEFVVLVEDLTDAKYLGGVAQKLLSAAKKAFVIDGHEVQVSASIGIATYPVDGKDANTLLRHADAAMYKAKESGKNNFQYYSEDLNTHSLQRLALESSLTHALERKQLYVEFQPIVDQNTGRLLAAESLLRWQHPDIGVVSPNQFIPLAEENGIIEEIGQWVLEESCLQSKIILKSLPDFILSVNLSERELMNPELTEKIKSILQRTAFPGKNLQLEIPETLMITNPDDAVVLLHDLKDLGIRIALDDFGTGYSSLAGLKKFPISAIKVDRNFLQSIPNDQENLAMTATVCAIGQSMGIPVIAEGVETEEQKTVLLSMECTQAQGWLFDKPQSPQDFLKKWVK
jgi:diguanylate cyclase (GGDEF)-like protein